MAWPMADRRGSHTLSAKGVACKIGLPTSDLPVCEVALIFTRIMAGRIVRNRCVILLGKSGAGKSFVANHLVGHDPLSPDEPPFVDEAREVKHETVEFMWENDLYQVMVVDTPGLFIPDGIDLIYDRIVQYVRETKLRIDLIFFVLKKGRFTREETAMFSFIMAKFRAVSTSRRYPNDVMVM